MVFECFWAFWLIGCWFINGFLLVFGGFPFGFPFVSLLVSLFAGFPSRWFLGVFFGFPFVFLLVSLGFPLFGWVSCLLCLAHGVFLRVHPVGFCIFSVLPVFRFSGFVRGLIG